MTVHDVSGHSKVASCQRWVADFRLNIHQGHTEATASSLHEQANQEVDEVVSQLFQQHKLSFGLSPHQPGTASHRSTSATNSSQGKPKNKASAARKETAGPTSETLLKEYCRKMGWGTPVVSSQDMNGDRLMWRCNVKVTRSRGMSDMTQSRESDDKRRARRFAFSTLLQRFFPHVQPFNLTQISEEIEAMSDGPIPTQSSSSSSPP